MQRPLKITSRDFELTAPIESEIREKAAALESYYERLSGCEVTLQAPAIRHHRRGGPFVVRIRMTVPGRELAVDHQAQDELPVAIREAFDAARRRLEDYGREQRRAVKAHELPLMGRVIRVEPELDYGFLETADGREIYFHRNSVLDGHFDQIEVGTQVRFAEEAGNEGPQASTVIVTGPPRRQ